MFAPRHIPRLAFHTQTRRLQLIYGHIVAFFVGDNWRENYSGSSKSKTGLSNSAVHCSTKTKQNSKPTARKPKYKNMATLETLNFDNLALRSLPIDPEKSNFTRQVAGACFSKVKPTPVKSPHTVIHSFAALSLLDLAETEVQRPEFAQYLCGNKVLPGADPAAHCYCGHQFGHFAGQLGDGATM